jgi:hypothetical protein
MAYPQKDEMVWVGGRWSRSKGQYLRFVPSRFIEPLEKLAPTGLLER